MAIVVENMYSMEGFKRFVAQADRVRGFKDSDTGLVLTRNLTAVDPRIFLKLYPELTFVNSGITVDNSGGYVRRIQSLRVREQGKFATSGDFASDKGKISLAGEDSFLPVVEREAHSRWSDTEIREAELQNINIVSKMVEAHAHIYQREIDEIGLLGIPDESTSVGLLNYGFTSVGSAAISTLTVQQAYDVIADLINAQWSAVNNTPGYMANKVMLPINVINTLKKSIISVTASKTAFTALKENFPEVEFMASYRCNSVGGTSVCAAFSNSDQVMKMRIPEPLVIGEIIKQNSFDYRVDSKYRIGGLDVLEPSGGYLLTGL